METTVLPLTPSAYQLALKILKDGGLVAFPTDTVYGVGSLAFDGKAVESIFAAKARPVEKAIPVLIGAPEDMQLVASEVPLMAALLARRFWAGPLTLVVPKHPRLPQVISETDTVGVRLPDHPAAQSLLKAAGPMAVTSANLSGQPSPSTAAEVLAQLDGRIPLILDGGATPGGVPSTVVDCSGPAPRILREGPISLAQIEAVIGLF